MFENPRRGRQARNFTTNVPKILVLKSSSEQIIFPKIAVGCPWWILATSCSSDKSLRLYQRISVKISVSATELCCHNRWYKFSLIWLFRDLLQRQNSVVETKIFTNILQTTPSDLSLRRDAATCCESPDLHTRSDLSPRRIAATCGLVCSDFVREQHALKWSFKFNQYSEMQLI